MHASLPGAAPKSHGPHEHAGPTQACVPVHTPTVQDWVAPSTHAKPSSGAPSQSSSFPLQLSAGGLHASPVGTAQPEVHVPEPIDAHVVVHATTLPAQQANVLSHAPSQSSSLPLQLSAGGAQALPVGIAQLGEQVPAPCEPHVVVHETAAPWQHAKPLSQPLTQSSSLPLHVSAGGVQSPGAGIEHCAVQMPVPVDAHAVVQLTVAPGVHA